MSDDAKIVYVNRINNWQWQDALGKFEGSITMIVKVDAEASINLMKKLAQMRESGDLCDFTVFVSGMEIKAHKCVLSACCDYFKTSFSFSELSQSATQVDLTHLGSEAKVVEDVIRSFYTNEIDLDPNSLEVILQLVDYFMCDSLRMCIERFMESTLNFQTAVTYFQLALQYRLHSTELLSSTKWLMYFRFHDYFIYQPETLESSIETVNACMTYGIFHYCNPLQLVDFMLKNVKDAVKKFQDTGILFHTDLTSDVCERINSNFQILYELLNQIKPDILEKWKPLLVNYLKFWKKSSKDCESELLHKVQDLENVLSDKKLDPECFDESKEKCHSCQTKLLTAKSCNSKLDEKNNFGSIVTCSSHSCKLKNDSVIHDFQCKAHMDGYEARSNYCACISKPTGRLPSLDKSSQDIKILPPEMGLNGLTADSEEPLVVSVTDKDTKHKANLSPKGILTTETNKDHIKFQNLFKLSDKSPTALALMSKNNETLDESFPTEKLDTDTQKRQLFNSEEQDFKDSKFSNSVQQDTNNMQCNILVVLAPSAELISQMMAVDDGQAKPLLRSPKLELSFFDIEMNSWCQGYKLDFPLRCAMLEKHAWRIAYLDNCFYMFSLGKEVALKFNTDHNKWENLDCPQIFTPHGDNFLVKSVIPIKVGEKLIVLSMSRKVTPGGSYLTKQYYFEMNPISKTFTVVASVEDNVINLPITQWTASGNILVTIKFSTMMNLNLTRVQYIHVYNSETRRLKTHNVDYTMESGIKLVMKDHVLYLLDRECWCRSYDLESSAWTEVKKYPDIGLSSPLNSLAEESFYPALTRVTCHAGSSRWEITTSRRSMNTRMQETLVSPEGELNTTFHPPPPFQFMTAMCSGTMSRSKLNSLNQPRFMHLDNQMLSFLNYNQT